LVYRKRCLIFNERWAAAFHGSDAASLIVMPQQELDDSIFVANADITAEDLAQAGLDEAQSNAFIAEFRAHLLREASTAAPSESSSSSDTDEPRIPPPPPSCKDMGITWRWARRWMLLCVCVFVCLCVTAAQVSV
jgi:hypothetical protein